MCHYLPEYESDQLRNSSWYIPIHPKVSLPEGLSGGCRSIVQEKRNPEWKTLKVLWPDTQGRICQPQTSQERLKGVRLSRTCNHSSICKELPCRSQLLFHWMCKVCLNFGECTLCLLRQHIQLVWSFSLDHS